MSTVRIFTAMPWAHSASRADGLGGIEQTDYALKNQVPLIAKRIPGMEGREPVAGNRDNAKAIAGEFCRESLKACLPHLVQRIETSLVRNPGAESRISSDAIAKVV